ncbi:glycerophosphodiester phosphodiesterase [Clostridium aciditolerans]|uniref:Glycerophosphodiester phosphodiesterase n=1 Tax=Clostridium aciditolerans TaxID=339861 RepID=A0A934I6C3_9CLOT|nr:glycerophosphodiester phosphodiesterase [Clostridium aciditolerans]MBI6875756.1 glycerophosphodiester phosphodiesterase [Clostridium aciditolerans]
MKKILNIAHRGFSGIYPENTMLAFEKAVEVQCDGIETDVQLTKDGVAVICHDETLERSTDGSGFIKNYTYLELSKLDAGIKKDHKFSGCRIPTLDEFLDYIKDKNMLINLELKNSIIQYENIEEVVIDKVYKYGIQANCIISSFNHYSMVKCKELDNSIKTGLLYDEILYHPEKYIKYVGADALHPNFQAVYSKEIVENIKSKNIDINVYTVNEEEDMINMISLGVDGIITNYPDRLKDILLRTNI